MDTIHGVDLSNLTQEEKDAVMQILGEVSRTGTSDTYSNVLYSDYDEIPVGIDEFLHNPVYLGRGLVDEEQKFTVYPYWVETLKKVFPDPLKPAQYNTLALTGAIGLGKSFEAVLCCLYELYRMLCLKDPYLYYGLQPIDKITFALMNITIDAAKGVAWDKLQQLLQSSEWFMNHGAVSRGLNPQWSPNKKIELICGSQSRHIIGRAVFFCLDGETEILTNLGTLKLKDCVDKEIQVFNIDEKNAISLSETCTVKPTLITNEEIQIELEDGTLIQCTPNHRFMLKDGSYKEAQFLTTDDDILDFNPIGYVYRTTNLITGTTYIGQHKKKYFDQNYLGSGLRVRRELKKYSKSNFKVELLCWARSIEELNNLESEYISKELILNERCLNLSLGAKGGHENSNRKPKTYRIQSTKGKKCITNGLDIKYVDPNDPLPEGWVYRNCRTTGKHDTSRYYSDAEAQSRNSIAKSGINNSQWNNSESHECERNGSYEKGISDETREKISNANKGRKYSDEINLKKGRKGIAKPSWFGDKVSNSSIGKIACNNGIKNTWITKNTRIPEGFVKGWIKK